MVLEQGAWKLCLSSIDRNMIKKVNYFSGAIEKKTGKGTYQLEYCTRNNMIKNKS